MSTHIHFTKVTATVATFFAPLGGLAVTLMIHNEKGAQSLSFHYASNDSAKDAARLYFTNGGKLKYIYWEAPEEMSAYEVATIRSAVNEVADQLAAQGWDV